MMTLLWIASGGALGASSRFWLGRYVHSLTGLRYPYGTLTVNVLGCLLMGILAAVLLEQEQNHSAARQFLLIGFLGSFTTFSSFALETMNLAELEHGLAALMNVGLNVALCLLAVWIGHWLGKCL